MRLCIFGLAFGWVLISEYVNSGLPVDIVVGLLCSLLCRGYRYGLDMGQVFGVSRSVPGSISLGLSFL